MRKIGTIPKEKKKCQAAFASHPNTQQVWCYHHDLLCEELTGPAQTRIDCILSSKPKGERAARLRNFRPVKNISAVKAACDARDAAVETARAAYSAAVKPFLCAYAYAAAVKAAMDTYDAAVETAQNSLQVLHQREWPDNTWNGTSIF